MIGFYYFKSTFLLILLMGTVACTILQGFVFASSIYLYRPARLKVLRLSFEGNALIQTIIISMLIAQVYNNMIEGFFTPSGFTIQRNLFFFATLLLAIILCFQKRTFSPLLVAIASFVTLPATEQFIGHKIFPFVFVFVSIFWGLRSIYQLYYYRKELQNNISALSIKQAIDALQTGVLFCDENGEILLINKSMQRLMNILTGETHRNAIEFYKKLQDGRVLYGYTKTELEGQMVYRFPDESAWLFLRRKISTGKAFYYQISAVEVTTQWNTTVQLEIQNATLQKKSDELKSTLANMYNIFKKEEALQAKSRIHDMLGQRIALLVRSLREQGELDMDLLSAFENGLPEELKKPPDEQNITWEFNSLVEIFGGIGVNVIFWGEWPRPQKAAKIILDIIAESSTNAVRHGFCSRITIFCEENEEEWKITIANNGIPPSEAITEGGGIKNMRLKLAEVSGSLTINTNPEFTLYITLPKGFFYDKRIDS